MNNDLRLVNLFLCIPEFLSVHLIQEYSLYNCKKQNINLTIIEEIFLLFVSFAYLSPYVIIQKMIGTL